MKIFTTPKGTALPITSIKGKDYLEAKYRVVWFREERPDWGIETEIVFHNEERSLYRATIRNELGRIMAQASKEETRQGFADHLEKSETSAIARALALIGFGTQFASELEEGERIVDAPISDGPHDNSGDPGAYIIAFGKYNGKRLDQIGPNDCRNYANYIRDDATKKGKAITGKVLEALEAIHVFCESFDGSKIIIK